MAERETEKQKSFVNWFRDSSPYIHAHRNHTFVIGFGGEALQSDSFAGHVHDFALLLSLGIRLVLVHGIRPQIDERLRKLEIRPLFEKNLRITDEVALQCVKEAAGTVRVEIEALLSMGLTNSPMSGAKIRVTSGNFITAKPIGVIGGVDFCHTGNVRRVDSANINQQLEQNNVVLISPIGYSPSGEIFNLSAEEVATEVAITLKAQKLILMTEQNFIDPRNNRLIAQMTLSEAENLLEYECGISDELKQPLQAAIRGCRKGVDRVHLLNRNLDGALLIELFSRDGIGTMISANPYEEMRLASLSDIPGILELIVPLEKQGKLIKRSRERLEMDIGNFTVIERDGLIIGCTALHVFDNTQSGEIACLAIHPDYQNSSRGKYLLEHVFNQAKQKGLNKLFVLSTQTMHWFIERGFQPISFEALPGALKKNYNHQRNSKVLYKNVD
ncbi:MAG: amino-acid N-acetyltransferase [Gammaproteobacteria bacterium]